MGRHLLPHANLVFPRKPSESPKAHCVEEKLKKRQKIYQISHTEAEVRVNDYNPLLLLLWKASADIQFVSESSLALAHYVSGYVTKAERKHERNMAGSERVQDNLWSSVELWCMHVAFKGVWPL